MRGMVQGGDPGGGSGQAVGATFHHDSGACLMGVQAESFYRSCSRGSQGY